MRYASNLAFLTIHLVVWLFFLSQLEDGKSCVTTLVRRKITASGPPMLMALFYLFILEINSDKRALFG